MMVLNVRKRFAEWREFRQLRYASRANFSEEDNFVEEYSKMQSEVNDYLMQKISSPVGAKYFNPTNYLAASNPTLVCLRKTHRGFLSLAVAIRVFLLMLTSFVIWFLFFRPEPRWMFLIDLGLILLLCFVSWSVLERVNKIVRQEDEEFDNRMEHVGLGMALEMRYANTWAQSRYEYSGTGMHAVFGGGGRSVSTYAGIPDREWKEVEPGRFIIIETETGLEIPLLPESEPHLF